MDKEVTNALKKDDFDLMLHPADFGRIREEFSKNKNKETSSTILEYITTEQVTFLSVSVFGFISFIIILVLLKESLTSLLELTKVNNAKQ